MNPHPDTAKLGRRRCYIAIGDNHIIELRPTSRKEIEIAEKLTKLVSNRTGIDIEIICNKG